MRDASGGIYVHIPWCRSICTYCDFDRQAHAFELIPAYVEALVADIARQPAVRAHSVFFGGGTPSLLEPGQIGAVLRACRQRFEVVPGAEITVEANPGDLDAALVAGYVAAGVNRFSLGVQSFDDMLLRLLGRRHTGAEAEEAIREARRGGAANLSLDLMYGLPGQDARQWRETLERAVALETDHISAYLLTIDDRVPLGRQVSRGRVSLPIDDEIAEMYGDAQRMLAEAGFEQYEISNWSRPGRASRHNLTYWRDEPYLGIGSGAASSFSGRRYKNTTDPAAYIAAVGEERAELIEDEVTEPPTAALDYLALRLRLREGLPLGEFMERFGQDLTALGGNELEDMVARGILERIDGRLRVSAGHLLVSNEVIVRLHEAVEQKWSEALVGRDG